MSLLFDAQDVVLVYVEEAGEDGDGNPCKVPSQYPIKVRGRVCPYYGSESGYYGASSTQAGYSGQEVGTLYKLVCRSFPAGAYAHVEWQGRKWDVSGEPMRSTGSPGVAHVTVMLRARRPEVRYG